MPLGCQPRYSLFNNRKRWWAVCTSTAVAELDSMVFKNTNIRMIAWDKIHTATAFSSSSRLTARTEGLSEWVVTGLDIG